MKYYKTASDKLRRRYLITAALLAGCLFSRAAAEAGHGVLKINALNTQSAQVDTLDGEFTNVQTDVNSTFVNISSCLLFYSGQIEVVARVDVVDNISSQRNADSLEESGNGSFAEFTLPISSKFIAWDQRLSGCFNNTASLLLRVVELPLRSGAILLHSLEIGLKFKRTGSCPAVASDWSICEATVQINATILNASEEFVTDGRVEACSSTPIAAGDGVSFACEDPSVYWAIVRNNESLYERAALTSNGSGHNASITCGPGRNHAAIGVRLKWLQVQPFNTTGDKFSSTIKHCEGLRIRSNINGTWIAICTIVIVLTTCAYSLVKVFRIFALWLKSRFFAKEKDEKTAVLSAEKPAAGSTKRRVSNAPAQANMKGRRVSLTKVVVKPPMPASNKNQAAVQNGHTVLDGNSLSQQKEVCPVSNAKPGGQTDKAKSAPVQNRSYHLS